MQITLNIDPKQLDRKSADAFWEIGLALDAGIGMSADPETARTLFELAANGGNPDAMNHIGFLYETGDGYKKDVPKAKELFEAAADMGCGPKKPTILALAVALELSLKETRDLLARAGYALSHASKFDVIIEYFHRQPCL